MMYKNILLAVLTISLFAKCSSDQTNRGIIPLPVQIISDRGCFRFDNGTVISVWNETQATVARQLSQLFTTSAGFTPEVRIISEINEHSSVAFYTDMELPAEHYRLEITPSHIYIKAADNKGFFYAIQTLRMMLPPAIESREIVTETQWDVPVATIQDGPRFPYRGMMLDVARTFIPAENVKKLIDCMSMLKLNRLHLHLTDGNGWRLEIKKHPKLTEIGAWRVDREGDFSQRKNAVEGEPTPIGGFYTQEEMKDIIAYAADRQVEIIPEIDMPAHTNASLAAYPQLACPVVKDFIGVLPGMGAYASEFVYCAGNDSVYTFLEEVIDEVATLFPAPYIHIGGDEASKKNWKKCPLCQARMKAENIADPEELQGYFMNRIADYVKSKGKQVMGWDELINSKIPEKAIVYGWRGLGDAGYKAGQLGHPFIMTPARALYLIRYQGPQWFEPRTYFGNNTLKDVYDYEPIQPDWKPQVSRNLIGVQASLWTEFLNSPEDAEYLIFPRLAALAETAWSEQGTKNWPDFLKRLDILTQHYDRMGINYARSMYNIDHYAISEEGRLKVSLSCIRPDVQIRYTTDGSEPTASSPLYTDTIQITEKQTIHAATYCNEVQKGQTLRLPFQWNKATACPIFCGNKQTYRLTNGLRGSDKHSDFEWCGWYGKDTSFVIDLQKAEQIRQVTVGCITNYGMGVHIPKSIRLSLSDDGETFTQISEQTFTPKQIFHEGIQIEDKTVGELNATGRFLKVELENPGKCPEDHIRPGQDTWVYIDEIIIE